MDLSQFVAWLSSPPRSLEPDSAELYAGHVRRAWVKDPVGYVRKNSLSPKTRGAAKAALIAYARFIEDDKLIEALRGVRIPKGRVRVLAPLEDAEWRRLRGAVDKADLPVPLRSVLGIMAVRGLRVSDVLRIRRDEVSTYLRTETLPFQAKGGARLQFRSPQAKPYFEALHRERGWDQVWQLVASSKKAARMAAYRALKQVAADAGLRPEDVHPHRLRRTYAVHFLRQLRGDPEALAKLMRHMGWSDLRTTFNYVDHVSDEALDEVQDKMFSE